MLNTEKGAIIQQDSITQQDFYVAVSFYALSANAFLEILRSFVPETMLFQFTPGSYLNVLFNCLGFLVLGSSFVVQVSTGFEGKKAKKSVKKVRGDVSATIAFFYYFFITLIALNLLIPISLDSINQFGEDSLLNILPFNKIVDLEVVLFCLFIFLSQLPSMLLFLFINEKDVYKFLGICKSFVFFSIVSAGLFTPTIDSYTQLSFALFSGGLYFLSIHMFLKRLKTKFVGINSLTS
jgi:hypothetical protein